MPGVSSRIWVVTTACAHHDTQKALEWAVGYCRGPEVLKSLHITIKSVRQAFDCIQGAIPLFLQRHLHFNPTCPSTKGRWLNSGQLWVYPRVGNSAWQM